MNKAKEQNAPSIVLKLGRNKETLPRLHNDWKICEPAVYVFSDRIKIYFNGVLPYGQTKEMFFKGASNQRNVSLMRILSDLEYVEQMGHGIPEIISHYGKEAFDVNNHYINVVIPFDKEVMESRAKSRLALNEGDGTQLALILLSAKKN